MPSSRIGQASRSSARAEAGGEDDRAPEHRLLFGLVLAAEGLGDEAGGAGTQEVERREDDVEDDRADGEAADQRGVAELADHRRVDDAEDRRRQEGQRHRHRDGKDHAVGHLEGARDTRIGAFHGGNFASQTILPGRQRRLDCFSAQRQ
jgi:hypothetical protein